MTTVTAAPTIGLTKSASPSVVNAGANVTFSMNWAIGGNSQATNVVIIDTVPANTTFVSADLGGTYDSVTNKVTWNLGTKNPGNSGTVSMIVKTTSPLANGTIITNTATIDSAKTDPPVSASASVTVTSGPLLTITKTVDKSPVNPGGTIAYTVTVKNTGNDTAINTDLTDLLPSGFTFVDFGGSSHSWTLGNLAAGQQVVTTYKVLVGAGVTAGVHENLAVAAADNYPNVTAKAPVTVIIPQVLGEEAKPLLVITKSVDKEFINPGGTANYTIKVENKGDAVAVNVMLQDVLPAGFTFDDKSITKDWKLGDIAPGAFKTITYKANSDPTILPGSYENLAVAWADNHDNVDTSIKLDVRAIKVLGLPTTGSSVMTYVYFFIAGLALAFALFSFKLTLFGKEQKG